MSSMLILYDFAFKKLCSLCSCCSQKIWSRKSRNFLNGKKAAIFKQDLWIYFLLVLKCKQNLKSFPLFIWKVHFFSFENSLPRGTIKQDLW